MPSTQTQITSRHEPPTNLQAAALDAAAIQDWDGLRLKLHPHLHWTLADGETLRGRNSVLAMLTASPPPVAPLTYALRDGQIYRWIVR